MTRTQRPEPSDKKQETRKPATSKQEPRKMAFESKNWLKLLLRWLSGAANRREETQLEVLAADDPFLADAFDGYREFPEAAHLEDVARIKGKLRAKYQRKERRIIPIWRVGIAASVLVLATAGIWNLFSPVANKSVDLAMNQEPSPAKSERLESMPTATMEEKVNTEVVESTDYNDKVIDGITATNASPNDAPSMDFRASVKKKEAQKVTPPSISPSPGNDFEQPLAKDEIIETLPTKDQNVEKGNAALAETKSTPSPAEPAKKSFENLRKEALAQAEAEETGLEIMDIQEEDADPGIISGNVEGKMETARSQEGLDKIGFVPLPPKPRQISGLVTDQFGEPLIGANVLFAESQNGTMTDIDGRFTLLGSEADQKLEVTYTGFAPQKVEIYSQNDLNISLNESEILLDEVVVSDYSSREKRRASKSKQKVETLKKLNSTSKPIPEGGFEDYKEYLINNLQFPDDAVANGISGEVLLKFTVLPNGLLSNFQIQKPLGFGCDEEAIRLLNEGPKWISPIAQEVSYAITFSKD